MAGLDCLFDESAHCRGCVNRAHDSRSNASIRALSLDCLASCSTALIWAMARTHPDKAALAVAFQENSNIMKTRLLNEPISETYIQGFDRALSQILGRLK